MDSARWTQVDRLLQAALEKPRHERDAFLDRTCGGDAALERDVRAMLALEDHADRLLERPAIDLAASVLAAAGQDLDADATDTLVGCTISHYAILEKLGAGGMGVVYKAQDTRLQRFVALKFLGAAMDGDPAAVRRFRQESRAASGLNHPHVCTVYDIGEADGRSFIAMELLEGRTLREAIADGRGLDLPTVVAIGLDVAAALEAAHAAGIVHRDVKPANIFLSPQGSATVLDFGLAKVLPTVRGASTSGSGTDVVVGTAAYMAPEQAHGGAIDHRADLWAFGLVLFEMATGRRPSPGAPLRVPSSAGLERVIARCLQPNPADRYQSASEIRADLQSLLSRAGATGRQGWITNILERPTHWTVLVGAVALAAIAAGAISLRRAPALTSTDTLVLADFTNSTSEPVFDDALRQGLAIQLQQSPFLSLVSDERIQGVLRLMGQPPDARLTPPLARDVCLRTASAAVLEGSIAPLGTQYVVALRARQCRTGDILDQEQIQAGKEDVLKALSTIARTFRTRIGESLVTVDRHNVPLEEATTGSTEALEAYTLGRKLHLSKGPAALPLFKRATELDPAFAMAHAFQATAYHELGEAQLSAGAFRTAYELRDRVSDRERFFITNGYALYVTGDLQAAQQACELWAQTYPREWEPHGFLTGMILPVSGQFERGIEEGKRTLELNPEFAIAYETLAMTYVAANRPNDAAATLRLAAERKLDYAELQVLRYDLAFLTGDRAQMEALSAPDASLRGAEDLMFDHQGLVLGYAGRLRDAKAKVTRAIDIAVQSKAPERAALFQAGAALWDGFFGHPAQARQGAKAALALSHARDVQYGAALALALAGDWTNTQRLTDDLARRFPDDTAVRSSYLPVLRARLALGRNDPGQAIEALRPAATNELGVPPSGSFAAYGAMYPVYVRGEAFLAAHRGAEAVAEFRKIVDRRGIIRSDPVGALAHLQLARALALAKDKPGATSAYREFFALWADADPDLPILALARAEFSALR